MSDVSISLLPVSTYETIPMTSRLPDGEEKKPDQEARAEEQPQREQVINGWWIYLFQCFISNIC